MNVKRLFNILDETTFPLRRGPEVEINGRAATEEEIKAIKEKGSNAVPGGSIVEIWAMPHVDEVDDEDVEKVDCHFLYIGVRRSKAKEVKEEVRGILREYPAPERLAGGPSFIEVGGELGDQERAFRLFGLGKVLGFWDILTPESLGITGEDARRLAGNGLLMISGFKDAAETA